MLFMTGNAEPGAYIFEMFRKGITSLLLTVIMGMGAVMFFRISKRTVRSGTEMSAPFTSSACCFS